MRKFEPLKHLKVIQAVKGELALLKNRFQETKQKLCTDSEERLRWTEVIMALLLRVDSLQGVSLEVRLVRKALSKELQMFMETIDTLEKNHVQAQSLNHLKVIKSVKEELDTFKNKFRETSQRKTLRDDSKERLRWGEGIMTLLLRLDSLQGVFQEVHLVRKGVTKELMIFQETIDTLEHSHLLILEAI